MRVITPPNETLDSHKAATAKITLPNGPIKLSTPAALPTEAFSAIPGTLSAGTNRMRHTLIGTSSMTNPAI